MIRSMLLTGSALIVAEAAFAQNYAVANAKAWTGTDRGVIEDATIIVRDGRIAEIGENLPIPSAGITTFDAEGRWVTPGIISAFSRTGIVEVGAEDSTDDRTAGGSGYNAALKAAYGFNPDATAVDVTRIEGVTRMIVAPGASDSIFGGQGFVASTSGGSGSISDEAAFMYVELGRSGANRAGGNRAAAWTYFTAALSDARTFPARYISHNEGDAISRVDARALGPAAKGEQKMVIRADRASDLRLIMSFAEQNPELDIIILGAAEGWLVAEELAAAGLPVIIDPVLNLPGSFDGLGTTMQNALRLQEAGVTVAYFYSDNDYNQARLTLQAAGNAAANGVSFDDALSAITTGPAEIFGLDNHGRLAEGAIGDLVVWDGDPLEVTSAPLLVLIDGKEQSLESRQTRLRDRYLKLERSDLPPAYTVPQ
jgi:imidazolonepropionase-like amidohydrolase